MAEDTTAACLRAGEQVIICIETTLKNMVTRTDIESIRTLIATRDISMEKLLSDGIG